MKKTTTLLFFTLLINALSFAQTHIPDKNFANAIRDQCPTCIDGNDNLTAEAGKWKVLEVANKNIKSLEGIGGFISLTKLNCGFNELSSLPTLPQGLLGLDCYYNQLISLPALPENLTWFGCYFNQLTSLPILPQSLTLFDCFNNQLTSLPNIPQGITRLDCHNNQLISLPVLPQGLTWLDCVNNQLTTLPELPNGLLRLDCYNNKLKSLPTIPKGFIVLDCYNNQLTSLPPLPQGLKMINCYNNQLTSLPILPNTITFISCYNNKITSLPLLPQELLQFECYNNQLTSLPALPPTLMILDCRNNQLSTLPKLPQWLIKLNCNNNQLIFLPSLPQELEELYCENNLKINCINDLLPSKLKIIDFVNTNIKCLPNKPTGIANNPLPICDATNSNTCFAFPQVKGNVFLDLNDDGIKNNDDVVVTNQLMEVNPYGFAITDSNGNFSTASDTSKSLIINMKNVPSKFVVKPIERKLNTSAAFAQAYDKLDFRLVSNEIFSDIEVNIVSSVQRPGFEGTLTLTYRNIGTTVLFGQIKLEKDPILTYLSATPKENAINGHTIVWDYSDLKPFESRVITLRVKVPATTPINTKLTNKMFASYNVLNNYYETQKVAELTTVVGSYDPNDKTASVKNLDPQDIIERKPIIYTIRFQNTGTYHAERVEIQDTISSLFDLSTFKNIAVSHSNCTVTFEKDRFKVGQPTVIKWTFEPIFLPDSTANEPASHGFVRFSIQPKQGLPIGTVLSNKAFIYFDYNLPIITNTSTVKVEKTIKVKQITTDILLKVYPNPSSDRLFVETLEDLNGELILSNLLGQVIDYQINSSTGTTVFDLQHLPKGVYILTLKTEQGNISRKVVKD